MRVRGLRSLLLLTFASGCRPQGGAPIGADATLGAGDGVPVTVDASASAPDSGATHSVPERIRRLREERLSPRCPPGMAYVPAGTFTMGSIGNEPDLIVTHPMWELEVPRMLPAHRATVAGFCIDVAPVTVGEYVKCITGGTCSNPPLEDTHSARTGRCNWARPGHAEHPIDCVDWTQARNYCEWAGRRMPTEIEWERAARGQDERFATFGTRETVPKGCNPAEKGEFTCPVASFPDARGPYGLFDMAFAATEWTASRYCRYPQHDCRANQIAVRGGDAMWATTTWRDPLEPSEQRRALTFRCAAEPRSQD